MFRHLILGAAALAGLPTVANAATLFSNDFSVDAAGFVGGTLLTAPSSQKFLGNLTQGAQAVLALNTTNVAGPLTLSFSLYGVLSLDGDGPAGGNTTGPGGDRFTLSVDGTATPLSDFSYANFPGTTQSAGGVGSAPQTTAKAVGALGYSFGGIPAGQADATYRFASVTINPTGASTVIRFIGNSNQDSSDEFFGIDDVLVTGNLADAVPEPATWGMMLLGFGLVGAAARRRRGTFAAA